jgi:hypothetical protein
VTRGLVSLLGGIVIGALAASPAGAQAAAQTIQFTPVGSLPGPADLIEVHDGRAYVIAGDTLSLVEVSNPSTPKPLGSYTFPQKIWGIRVVGTQVYVAADFFGLGILDVSNPGAPKLQGSIKTPGQAKNVAVFGTRAAVADHMSGVDFIDTTNINKPALLGSFFLDGYARDVATSGGSMAYAIDSPTGLYVFDLAKTGPLEPVSVQQSASTPGSLVVAEGSDPKVAVLVSSESLQIYDISKPAAPVKVATHATLGRSRFPRTALVGSRLYVADGSAGLQVLDLSTPKAPRVIGTYKTPLLARDVAVAGSHVFVVIGTVGEGPREYKDQEVLVLRQTP